MKHILTLIKSRLTWSIITSLAICMVFWELKALHQDILYAGSDRSGFSQEMGQVIQTGMGASGQNGSPVTDDRCKISLVQHVYFRDTPRQLYYSHALKVMQ